MSDAYLGLGSNIGNREENLVNAVIRVKKYCPLLEYSSMFMSSPVGYTEQSDFLNMVVKIDASRFAPHELLSLVKGIEHEMGREETFRWGPRLIDIDILYMDHAFISSDVLTIPHKELLNRLFVLVPLSELTDSLQLENGMLHLEDRIGALTRCAAGSIEDMVKLFKSRDELEFHAKKCH